MSTHSTIASLPGELGIAAALGFGLVWIGDFLSSFERSGGAVAFAVAGWTRFFFFGG